MKIPSYLIIFGTTSVWKFIDTRMGTSTRQEMYIWVSRVRSIRIELMKWSKKLFEKIQFQSYVEEIDEMSFHERVDISSWTISSYDALNTNANRTKAVLKIFKKYSNHEYEEIRDTMIRIDEQRKVAEK